MERSVCKCVCEFYFNMESNLWNLFVKLFSFVIFLSPVLFKCAVFWCEIPVHFYEVSLIFDSWAFYCLPWFTMFFSTKTDFTVKLIFKQSECAMVTSKLKISNWLHLFHQKSCLFVFLKIKFWISLSLHHETDIVQLNCSVLVLFSLQMLWWA